MPKYHIGDANIVTILMLILLSRTTISTSTITSFLSSIATTEELSTSTSLFTTTYLQSSTGEVEPSSSTALSTTTSLQSTIGTVEPSSSTASFTTTSLQSTTSTEEPSKSTALTTIISLQPTTGRDEPSTSTSLFTKTSLQPTITTEEPTTNTAGTTIISLQPTNGTEEPSTSTVLTTMTSPFLTRTISQWITGTIFTAITFQPSEITTEQSTANIVGTKITSPRSTSSTAITTLISPQWTTPNSLDGNSSVFATSTSTNTTSDAGASDAYVPSDSNCETTPLYIVIGILAGIILFLLIVLIAMFVRHNRIVTKSKLLPIPLMPMVCQKCREIMPSTGSDNVYVALDPECRNIPEEKPYDVLRRKDSIETPAVKNIYYYVKENVTNM
ncbi:hypothetical protein CHS0354_001235 [Potamilus streckersoni]|uniref:Uncharacterized protein n=1 Tax=Potamilus streckersoni TaxID=2493646 RepID=A0AAE0VPQ8_9BIVA|nr:hypothetical protein CHS0354_001235 [Potamilus streckersoni]